MLTLKDIQEGQRVIVRHINGRSSFRRRLSEMGFVRGKEILVLKNAPFKDPIEYEIMGYHISLRRSEAALIEVVPLSESKTVETIYNGTLEFERPLSPHFHHHGEGHRHPHHEHRYHKHRRFQHLPPEERPRHGRRRFLRNTEAISEEYFLDDNQKQLSIAFVGNPNAGKTSLYNALTGKQEHVGNYSGVTVDAKKAYIKHNGYCIELTDLPGTYSLSPNSPDEIFVRDHLLKKHPDVVVNVVDASNLERNLYLTTQLIDMDIPVVLALNMYDEVEKRGDDFKSEQFSKITGMPTIKTVGSKQRGIKDLIEKVIEVAENNDPNQRHIHINYGAELEQSINTVQQEIWASKNYIREYSSRHIALRLLEDDFHTKENIDYLDNYDNILKVAKKEIKRLSTLLKENPQTLITDARYGFIHGALKETLKAGVNKPKKSLSEKIDSVLTGKYTGFPIFLLFLWIMFQGTFTLGAYPADWIDMSVGWLGETLGRLLNDGPLKDLIVDGIIGGVGGVLVFLPNIVILFFFISLMEDTGYMARVAFIMDKLMHLIGLHGKSFIPLIMGFGCNVPAIMATRTLENRNDRLLTMLIIPFMSCSARLPVYILIAGAIFPKSAGTVIFCIYLAGIVVSIFTALLLKNTMFKKQEAPFVMELPPYRIPTAKSTIRHMWTKAKEYLKKMGSVILWASIIIWFLSYFPRTNDTIQQHETHLSVIEQQITQCTNQVSRDSLQNIEKEIHLTMYDEQQANSYLGRIGRSIEPALRPIGFDWKMSVGLLSGVVAKEIVVSTLGVIYAGDDSDDETSLREAIQQQKYSKGKLQGQKIYTKPTTLAFLVFILIYIPCIAVIAAIRKESGKWKWALFNTAYATSLAWIVSFLVSKIAGLFF